jgi:hypothetical protein
VTTLTIRDRRKISRERRKQQKLAETTGTLIVDILNGPRVSLYGGPSVKVRQRWLAKIGLDYQTASECAHELQKLVDSWLKAGCRLDRWAMREELEKRINTRELRLRAGSDGRPAFLFSEPSYNVIPDEFVRSFGTFVDAEYDRQPGHTVASRLFFEFLTGLYFRDLGRCAACGFYYLNMSGRGDKKFCSRQCATARSARKATRERRRVEFEQKLGAVKAAIRSFERLSFGRRGFIGQDWKGWVAGQAGLGITRNFITRCLNRKLLREPSGLVLIRSGGRIY